jgi:hypothetical protein
MLQSRPLPSSAFFVVTVERGKKPTGGHRRAAAASTAPALTPLVQQRCSQAISCRDGDGTMLNQKKAFIEDVC